MDVVVLSKVLIIFFVGSVTFWYMLTPYLVQPHPRIVEDLMTKTKLNRLSDGKLGPSEIEIENWTKWKIYLNTSDKSERDLVAYGHATAKLPLNQDKTILTMEWRSHYGIELAKDPKANARGVSAKRVEPEGGWWTHWGIYDHFFTEPDAEGKVKILPRFLFGIKPELVEDMYGDVSNFPVIGVFTDSPKFDRIIIQTYMNLVTLSVIFLLYANNPPAAVRAAKKKVN